MHDKNYQTYIKSNIVSHYAQLNKLQPAEQTIIELFRDRLSAMKMLDIGVGGGRTTKHFAPLVKEYTGIDYSAEMIAACQQRFSRSSEKIFLEVGDARNMEQFADNYFDFILFSFNGIDYVSHRDRLKIFQEIQRVGKTGCYFFFSTHNLQSIAKNFDYRKQISINPFKTYVNLAMSTLLKLFNLSITKDKLKNSEYLLIKDESHNFSLLSYYIRSKEQLKQLESNFNSVEIYSWKSGLKLIEKTDSSFDSDLWLYYLCVVN